MLYVIESKMQSSAGRFADFIDHLTKNGYDFVPITTNRRFGRWVDTYRSTIPEDIIKGIMQYYDYDLSQFAKSPKSSTIRVMRTVYPEACKEYCSYGFQDKKLSELITWFSKNPAFLKPFILYDSDHNFCINKLTKDAFDQYMPREYKNRIRAACRVAGFSTILDDIVEE